MHSIMKSLRRGMPMLFRSAEKKPKKMSLNVDKETVEIYYTSNWDEKMCVDKVKQELENFQKRTINRQKKIDEKTE